MIVPYDIDQAEWGSVKVYPDSAEHKPRYIAIHWGGGTSQIPAASEAQRLRIWQSYHINSKGWTDIAYNYAVGDSGSIFRCRGMNPGGHVKCSTDLTPEGDSYCDASIGIVWIGGQNDTDGPSDAALKSMEKIARKTGLIVKGHRTIKEENGSWTACPGPDWLQFIADEPWIDQNDDVLRVGDIDKRVEQYSWWLFVLEGGDINVNRNSSQVSGLLGKDNVRQFTIDDFNKIARHTNMTSATRDLLISQGIYVYGKEIAALEQAFVRKTGES